MRKDKMEKICEFFYLYRALPDKDITLANSLNVDLLSEAMSRVISSSKLNKNPYFLCFTEDPRIAIYYSKKSGYSGEVARIKVSVKEGKLVLVEDEDAEVYRTWDMHDWLYLMKKSNWVNKAKNLNYAIYDKSLDDIITYQGRKAPRAYAHADRGLIVHAKAINYEVLTVEEVEKLSTIRFYRLKSCQLLRYDFSDDLSQRNIRMLISSFKKKDNGKAHTRIMIGQLQELLV